jgi:hypothetical protein
MDDENLAGHLPDRTDRIAERSSTSLRQLRLGGPFVFP